jgi:hypothetical protein
MNRNKLPLLGEEGSAETQSKKPTTGKRQTESLAKRGSFDSGYKRLVTTTEEFEQ